MIKDYFPNIKGLIIDMDGVLWRDSEPLGDLQAIFDRIVDLDYKFILATNNPTRTVGEYQKKLAGFNVEIELDQIINSAQATGIYLQEHYPKGVKVFVVGEAGLKTTLESYGVDVCDGDETGIEAVVASLDTQLTYEKLKRASLLIQSGCEFIGTNADKTFPTPEGLIPGGGTVVGALEIASGQSAKILGKPEPYLYEMAMKRLALAPEETLAIGDRLESDIAGAQAAGIHSALVLTGVSTLTQAHNYNPPPEIIAKSLTELVFS